MLQASGPAYNRGIDPSTLSGLASSIVRDLKKRIYVDINERRDRKAALTWGHISTRLRRPL